MEIEDKILELEREKTVLSKTCAKSLKDIDNEIKELENELAKQKKDKYTLVLIVDNDNSLKACVNDTPILNINDKGQMSALNTEVRRDVYKQWVDNGMQISKKSVKWMDREYRINASFQLYSINEVFNGESFGFEYALAETHCEDDNIVRYKHNNTPILF